MMNRIFSFDIATLTVISCSARNGASLAPRWSDAPILCRLRVTECAPSRVWIMVRNSLFKAPKSDSLKPDRRCRWRSLKCSATFGMRLGHESALRTCEVLHEFLRSLVLAGLPGIRIYGRFSYSTSINFTAAAPCLHLRRRRPRRAAYKAHFPLRQNGLFLPPRRGHGGLLQSRPATTPGSCFAFSVLISFNLCMRLGAEQSFSVRILGRTDRTRKPLVR